jgi:hypothetical protein
VRGRPLLIAGILLLPVFWVLVYFAWRAEQDAAGRQDWAATLAHLRAVGDPTDFHALIPPAVPAAANLGAIDLFELADDAANKERAPRRLEAALHDLFDTDDMLPYGRFLRGEHVNRVKLLAFLSSQYRHVFPARPLPASPLAQFDDLCPTMDDLRQAALTHPDCRFDRDYTTEPPNARPLGGVTEFIQLEKAINLHAVTALDSGQPEIALQDIETTFALDAGLRKEPLLISGLVAIADLSIQDQAIWEGLEDHAWNDAQLVELQRKLASVDFLADGQLCLRGEALGYMGPMLDFLKQHQNTSASLLSKMSRGEDAGTEVLSVFWYLAPAGWFNSAKATATDLLMDAARELIDLRARRIYPQKAAAIRERVDAITGYEPPMLLIHVSIGPIDNAVPKFGVAQFRVDAARIACMIERYRLAHGSPPKALAELSPYAGAGGVPLDLCNGQPYHYSLRTDGTYLLYSVGWNLTDDGGQIVHDKDHPRLVDEKQGDWIWPQPGHAGT